MPTVLCQITCTYRGNRIRVGNNVVAVLNFDQPEVLNDQLTRHVIGFIERNQGRRKEAHLYVLEIQEMRNDRPYGKARTFALPEGEIR